MQQYFPTTPLVPDYIDRDVLPSFTSIRAKNLKTLYGEGGDKSPKGSVDQPILELVNLINSHPSFVTLSSCSGRIALFNPRSTTSTDSTVGTSTRQSDDYPENNNSKNKGGQWLVASHKRVDFETVWNALAQIKDDDDDDNDDIESFRILQDGISFRFEPMLLHVAAATLERGQQLLQIALQQGYRESGLIVTSSRITVAIRSYSLALVVPVSIQRLPISYWQALVQESNRRLDLNQQRLQQLHDAVADGMFRQSLPSLTAEPLPLLHVWGHTVVSVPVSDDKHDVLVFGGYGSGPQDLNDSTATTCKRLDYLYRLRCHKGNWGTRWDSIVSEKTSEDTFRRLKVHPFEWTARHGAACCRILNWDVTTGDKITIVGGVIFGGRKSPEHPLDDLILFEYEAQHNNESRLWFYQATEVRGQRPSARWGHTLTTVQKNHREQNCLAVLIGGRNGASVVRDSIYILSEHAGVGAACLQWEHLLVPGESIERFHHASIFIHDTAFVFGGLCDTNDLLKPFGVNSSSTPGVVSFTVSTTSPENVHLRGVESVPRLFGLCSCLMSSSAVPSDSNDFEHRVLLTGGISGTERELKRSAFLLVKIIQTTDCWDISIQELETDIDRIKNLGPLVHHQCTSLSSASDGDSHDVHIVSVGGGVSGFAFRPNFAASFVLSNRQGRDKLSRDTSSEQQDVAHKASRPSPSDLPETSDVIYVMKHDAKFVKTQLEMAALLNKNYRMCPADPSTSNLPDPSTCIAIPIDERAKKMLDERQASTTKDSSDESSITCWASLVVASGKQKTPRSTATFARQSALGTRQAA